MDFQPKKSLGQNFLNSDYVPAKLCDAAALAPGERVLEIGPGTGVLTQALLARGAQVVAVETDQRALAYLETVFAEAISTGQLAIIEHDARTLDPATLQLRDKQYKVVANIPYYLSGRLLRQLLDTETQPTTLVFLIQKELAERIARTKKSSLLSLSVAAFGTPRYITTIKRTHFSPPPQVDSAILQVTDITHDRVPVGERVAFFDLLHRGFGQKRKQLLGNLSATYPRESLTNAFETLELPLTARAEDLTLDDWLRLFTHLSSPDFSTANPR